jgi:hypothetical protein
VTSSAGSVTSVESFVRAVEQSCADLPDPVRQRLLADLRQHLHELGGDVDRVAGLGDPILYADELRSALGLPLRQTVQNAATLQRRVSPHRVPLLIGSAVTVLLAVVLVLVLANHSRPSAHSGQPHKPSGRPLTSGETSLSALGGVGVHVPNLVGLTEHNAEVKARRAGFRPKLRMLKFPAVAAGLIVHEGPEPGLIVPSGSTITLLVSTG